MQGKILSALAIVAVGISTALQGCGGGGTATTTASPGPRLSCGGYQHNNTLSLKNVLFADMHDGDQKNVTVSESGSLTISQDAPVAWSLSVPLDFKLCTAMVDFSKSKKPAHPPVPLEVRVLGTTVGTTLLEFTDPSGTLNPDKDSPLNVWTTFPDMSPTNPKYACADIQSTFRNFGIMQFQDMHDGDVKSVSIANGVLSLGQAGIWNMTVPLDQKTCKATVDFSKSDKPAKPPVPLVVSMAMATDKTDCPREFCMIMTWTDPTMTISPSAGFPLNMWLWHVTYI